MRNVFNSIRKPRVKYSNFDLTHERIFSAGMGNLVPICCQEIVAGDTFKNNTELLIRFAPLLAPIMHRIDVYTHFFFVPNRLIWKEWEDFITGGEDGNEDILPPMYLWSSSTDNWQAFFANGNLADYLGIPQPKFSHATNTVSISALPFRAYLKIYNDFYRDQNLEEEVHINDQGGIWLPSQEGCESYSDLINLKHRAWTKDYFSSALPFAQRGEDVHVPLDIDIAFKPGSQRYVRESGQPFPVQTGDPNQTVLKNIHTNSSGAVIAGLGKVSSSGTESETKAALDVSQTLRASEGSLTIRALRRMFALQRFQENNATGGSRYIEQLLARFGVVSDDARLQRAEYLGGGKQPVVISDTPQTSSTITEGTDKSVLGQLAGQGISAGKTHQFTKRFKEHGWLLGIMSVVPKPVYMQGLPRQFSRMTRYEYLTPEFAGIGEQEVKNKELFFTNADDADGTFGYQGRYNEYRYVPSTVHGSFRGNLDFWHLARKFANQPRLNSDFVHMDPNDFSRIFAVSSLTNEQMYVQLINHMTARRALPKYPYND
ncbi:major capsid protein [Microvirus mar2]|uniref:Major capsid protein n=1 Tax=Microvirus mar2 TaxID=2851152 RepID=A0A8F5RCN1_9VIRU|nr:major capsid protein [Microvirus mar2]